MALDFLTIVFQTATLRSDVSGALRLGLISWLIINMTFNISVTNWLLNGHCGEITLTKVG